MTVGFQHSECISNIDDDCAVEPVVIQDGHFCVPPSPCPAERDGKNPRISSMSDRLTV